MESTAACLFPRSGVTAPIADPSVGLKSLNKLTLEILSWHHDYTLFGFP
jgi:hypothetical protein